MTFINDLMGLPALLVEGLGGMTAWGYCNSILSSIAIVLIVWKLFCYSDKALFGERVGMALIAAGSTLVIAQIVANSGKAWVTRTPFDGWSTAMLRIGLILHFGTRIAMHRVNNWRQVRAARDWPRTR